MNSYYIYGLSCMCHPDHGVRYVGQTGKTVEARFYNHKWRAAHPDKGYRHKVYNWMRKHGIENIVATQLEEVSPDCSDAAEERWVSELGTFGTKLGLNLNRGGGGNAGWKHSPESIQRSVNNRVYTDEYRRKIGEASSKRIADPVLQEKMRVGREITAVKKHLGRELRRMEVRDLMSDMDVEQVAAYWKENPRIARLMGEKIGNTKRRAGVAPLGSPEYKEKMARAMRGTKRAAKLDESQVVEILNELHAGVGQGELAKKYGVDHGCISAIYSGKTWPDIARPWGDSASRKRRFMTEDEARALIQRFINGESIDEIATSGGMKRDRVDKVISGRTYPNIERPYKNA